MQTFIRKRGQGTFMHRKITLFYLGEIFALVNTKTNILFKLTTCDKFFSEETNDLVFPFAQKDCGPNLHRNAHAFKR